MQDASKLLELIRQQFIYPSLYLVLVMQPKYHNGNRNGDRCHKYILAETEADEEV